MKQLVITVFAAICLLLPGSPAFSQSYDLSWFTIDGGGGISTGGAYSLSGTIGQPDAGKLTGGSYTLEGGFWSGITLIQTPGSPLLKITLVFGNQAVISWPVTVSGFTLEETSQLGSGAWSPVATPIIDTATEHTVTVPALSNKFYRLKNQ